MKTTWLAVLLASLASSLAFGQKFQDVTAKGAPVSLLVKHDLADMGPYAAVRNKSSKGIIAFVAVIKSTDEHGQVLPCTGRADYVFKSGVLAPQEERFACPMDSADPGAKIVETVGAVFWVQFEDGSTWGDVGAGQQVLAARPKRLAFLKRLVETSYESGEDAFNAVLNDPTLGFPEFAVAGCLKSDAEYEKMTTIDLAKKRLAAAQEWRALGIF
jgi:hypothetical protein